MQIFLPNQNFKQHTPARNCIALLLFLVLFTTNSYGQTASSSWPLITDGAAINTGNITGSNLVSNGVGITIHISDGVSSDNWATGASQDAGKYYEFTVSPNANYNLSITDISIDNNTDGISGTALIQYAYDAAFTSPVTVGSSFAVSTGASATTNFNSLSVIVNNGQTLHIRVFAWDIENSSKFFNAKNFSVSGNTVLCLPDVSDFNTLTPSAVCEGSPVNVTVNSSSLATDNYTVVYDLSGANNATGLTAPLSFSAGTPGSGAFTIPAATLPVTGNTSVSITSITSTNSCTSNLSSGNSVVATLTSLPIATFSYTSSSYCADAVNPLPTFSSGGVAGVFSSTTGLVFVNTSTGEINLSASTPGTYTVTNTIVAAGGCGVVTANSSINIIVLPSASVSGTTTVCQGVASPNVIFTNPQALAITITYNINGGANQTINVNANATATVAAPTGSAGTFNYNLVSVVYQSAPTCSNAVTGTAIITVNPTPVVTISGTTTVCQGTTSPNVTVTNPQVIPVTVTYNINGGANQTINVAASSTNTIAAPTATAGTLNYNLVSVVYQSAPTCNNTISGTATITVRSTPTATVSGATTVCQNGASPNVTFTNPQALPITVTYNINGGANQTVNINASTTAVVAAPTTTAGTFVYNLVSVIYQSGPNCTNTVAGSATITVRPTPTATISGTVTVCRNGASPNVTFTNPQALAVTVTYNINSGANQTINVGASTTATVAAPTATAGTFNYNLLSVVYQTTPTCSNSISGTATVTVNPTPAPTISGTTTVCQNGTSPNITFTNPQAIAVTITYNINGGANQAVNVNASSSATVAAPTTTAGAFNYNLVSVVYQTSPTCNTTISGTATITVRPTPTATISGTTTVCQNTAAPNMTFTNPQALPITVTYNINGGANQTVNVNASTTATIAVPTTTAGTFNYNLLSVVYQSAPTCTNTISGIATVTVNPTPVPTISGTTAVCRNAASPNVTFTNAQAIGVVITYNINGGANQTISVAGNSSATIAAPTGTVGTFNYNLVSVVYQSGPTCNSAVSGTAIITIRPLPAVTLSASPAAICIGSGSTLTANNTGGTNTQTFTGTSGNINIAIPESRTTWAGSNINLTGSGGATLAAGDIITVTLDIDHNDNDQLDIFLIDPSGNRAMMVSTSNGGSGNGYNNALLQTGATPNITTAGNVTITGTWGTEGASNAVASQAGGNGGNYGNAAVPQTSLVGASIDGNWQIRVFDDDNAGGPGTLEDWAITITRNIGNYTSVFSGPATISAVSYSGANNATATVTVTPPLGTNNYTVTTTDAVGCFITSSATTVTVNPIPTVNATPATQTICSGAAIGAISITNPNAVAGTTFSWTRNNTGNLTGIAASGSGTSITGNLTNTTTTVQTTTFTITASAAGCSSVTTVTVTVNPAPTPTISGTTTVCQNGSSTNVTFTNPNNVSVTVTYNINGGANQTVNINANSTATVAAPTATAGTFNYNLVSVVYQSAPTCNASVSGTATVTVRPTPTATISGATTVCRNAASPNITFTNPQNIAVTVTYNINGGANQTVNVNASSAATVAAPTATAGTFNYNLVSVVYQSAPTCSNSISGTATVIVNPTPAPTISGTTTVCQNSVSPNITFTNPQAIAVIITYNINGGANQTINVNASSSATVAAPTATAGTFNYNLVSVVFQSTPTCNTTVSGTAAITVRPTPTATISGTTAVCQNGTLPNVTFTNPQNIAVTVTYNINGGANQTINVNGSSTATIAAPTGSQGIFNYNLVSVVYQSAPTCSNTISGTATITVNPLPVVSTSASSVCVNSTITASPSTGGTWISSNNSIATITNAGLITGVAAGSATFTYTITATGCSNTTSSVTVNALPVIAPITGGASSICVNDITIFSNATAGGAWSIVNGTGTASVDASGLVTGLSAGNVSVVYTYSNGICTNAVSVTLTINTIPTVGPISGGASSVCVNANTPAFTNATPGGTWSVIDGTGSATVNGGGVVTGVTAGSVTVVYTVDNGTCSNESAVSVTINPLPAVAVIGGGAPAICVNSSTPVFTNATAGGVWSIINGTGTASITSGAVVTGLTAGSVTVVYTVNNGTCSNTATKSLTINPLPVIAAIGGGASSVCIGSTTPAFTNATSAGVWSITNGTGTASITVGGVVTGLTAGNVTVIYTVTTGSGCTAFVTAALTVNSLPVANAITGTNTVCAGSTINLNSNATGTPTLTYTWSSDNGNTTVDNAGVITGVAAGSSNITYTVTNGNNCSATSPVFVVNVNARPTATITSANTTICDGSSVNITGNVTATGAWTLSLSNGVTATGTGNGTFSIAQSPSSSVTYTIASLSDANCTSIGADLIGSTTVTVNTHVTITAEPVDTVAVCATFPATFTVTATGSGLTYQWFKGTFPGTPVTNNANISGATTTSLHFNQASVADVDDYYVVVSGLTPCASVQSAYTHLSVDQTITITQQPLAQTVCTGSDAQFVVVASAGPDPLLYQWRKNGVDIPGANSDTLNIIGVTAADAGNYRVVITGIAGCVTSLSNIVSLTVNPPSVGGTVNSDATVCIGVNSGTLVLTGRTGNIVRWELSTDGGGTWTPIANTTAFQNYTNLTVETMYRAVVKSGVCAEVNSSIATISFYPVPDVIPTPSSQTACSGVAVTTIVLSGSVPSTTYTWTRNNTGAVTGMAASGSGNISGTLTNTTLSPITVTFTITPTANGCVGTPTTATVTVDPSPDAIATPASQSVCSGAGITTIILSSTVPATTYTWTRNNAGTVSGIAASGSGDISGALTNTTSSPVTVTFTITPTAAGCIGVPVTATATVNPIPDAVATPASQSICSGATITTIALTSAVTGTTYSWTRDNASTVTGIAAGGNGNISGALTNTTLSPVTVTFTITPSANGCAGIPITATVTVNPGPDAFATPSSQSVCSGTGITTIVFSSTLTSTYAWTRNNTGTVTGIAASGSGNISGSLTNTTTSPVTVTFTITPTSAGCPGTPITATVVVNPTPNAVATPSSQTICSGPIGNIVLSGNVSGTTYAWARNNTGTVTGIAANGSGDITGSLTNTTNANVTVTFTITPTADGCPGTPITATVLVRPTPTVSVTNNNQTVCGSVAITSMVISNPNTVAGTAYSWTRDNTINLTGMAASGTGTPISGTLVNNTATQQVTIFTVTATANTCASSTTATVAVNPRPSMTSANTLRICNNSAVNLALTSNIASAYTWVAASNTNVSGESTTNQSGNTINNTLVNTSASPGGGPISLMPRQNVIYTVTPTASVTGCIGVAQTVTVTVNPRYNISFYEYPNDDNGFTICDGDLVGGGGQNDMDLIEGEYSGATLVWQYSIGSNSGPWSPVPGPYVNGAIHDTLPPTPSIFSPMGNYYFRLLVEGCPSDTITMTKTSTLTIEAGPDKTVCQSGSPAAITLSGSTVGGTASTTVGGTWSVNSLVPANGGVNGTLSSTAFRTVPNIPTVTYTPPVNYSGVITLWLTSNDPDGNGPCGALIDSVRVFVSQAPIVANSPTMAICSGENTNIALTSVIPSTYTWTVGTITGGITGASAGSGDNINQVLNNPSTSTAGTVQYIITPTPTSPASCAAVTSSITVTVRPLPAPVLSRTPATVCAGSVATLTATNAGGTLSTILTGTNNTVRNISTSGTPTITSSISLPAGTITAASAITLSMNLTHSWAGDLRVTLISPSCGSSVLFNRPGGNGNNNDLSGTYTFVSSGGATFPANTNPVTAQTYNATFTGIAFPCNSAAGNWTLQIEDLANGDGGVLNYWSLSINATGTYTSVFNGPASIGSVSYSGAGNTTATASVTPPVGANNYTVTSTDAAGCSATSSSVSVTVNPPPTLTGATQQASVCAGSSAQINLAGLAASSTSTVTYRINGGPTQTVTNIIADAGGAASFNTIVLTAANNGQVLQVTSLTTTSASPQCSQLFTQNVILSVNATPTLTGATQQATVCPGSSAQINMTGLVPGNIITVTYTINGGPVQTVTNVSVSGGGTAGFTTIGLTAANNGQTLQITGITITSALPNCSQSFTRNITLAVHSTAALNSTLTPGAICSGSNFSYIPSSSTPGSSFSWTRAAVPGISQPANSGSGNINELLTNTTSTPVTVTFLVTTSANGCNNSPGENLVLTVNPAPSLSTVSQSATVCAGTGGTINLTGLIPNSTSTIFYSINGISQPSVAGVISNASGVASFTSANLTAANNGQVLRVTGVSTTSNSPTCARTFSIITLLSVNAIPTLSGATQAAAVCLNGPATINISGLVPNSTNNTINYTINGVTQTPVTGVNVNGSGTASFNTIVLTAANNGQVLQVTGITNGTCSQSFIQNVTLAVGTVNTWMGVNTNWFDTQNWCAGIPTSTTDVLIPGSLTNYPLLNTGTGSVRNITIQSSASVTVSGAVLQVAGTVTNTGIFNATTGTIELNGIAGVQSISGSVFVQRILNGLIISNVSGVNVSALAGDTLNIADSLSFGNVNSAILNTGDNVTLLSRAAKTARVSDITNGGANTGNGFAGKVIVERFIPQRRAWRVLSVPLQQAGSQTFNAAWQEGVVNPDYVYANHLDPHPGYGMLITGPTAGMGFDPSPMSNYSILQFNSSILKWSGVPNTLTAKVTDSAGYMVFVRGDRATQIYLNTAAPISNTILRASGFLKTNLQNNIVPAGAGSYTLVGNPYASSIDLRKVSTSGSVSGTNYVVWDPALTGANGVGAYQYLTRSGGPGTDYLVFPGNTAPGGGSYGAPFSVSNNIQSGQAFLVQNSGAGSVSINENAKIIPTTSTVFRPSSPVSNPVRFGYISTLLMYENGHVDSMQLVDGALMMYNNDYSNDIDLEDAKKVSNMSSESFGINSSEQWMQIEKRKGIESTDTIFFKAKSYRERNYQFRIEAANIDDRGLTAFLEDSYLQTSTPVSLNGNTVYRFRVFADSGAWKQDRFRIVFRQNITLPVTFSSVKAYRLNDKINVEWKTENEISIADYEVEKSVDGIRFERVYTEINVLNNGRGATYNWLDKNPVKGFNFYRIRSKEVNGTGKYTSIVKVAYDKSTADYIALYPNPLIDATFNLYFVNEETGEYKLRLLNSAGQLIEAAKINHSSTSPTEVFRPRQQLLHGSYILEITTPGGVKQTISAVY